MGHEARLRVSAGLERDRAALVERIVTEIYAEVPAYRALHASQLAEVRAIASWLVARSMELWVRGAERLPEEDVERLRGIGRARAADGRSLDAVVRAHRVGSAAAVRIIRERADGRLDTDDVFALSELWLTSLDQISESLSRGHIEAADRLDADRERARRALLDDLLVGRQSSRATVRDRARTLGIVPPDPAVLVVVRPTDEAAATVAAGRELLAGASGADPLVTTRAGRVVVLASAEDAAHATRASVERGWPGCVLEPRGSSDMASAYRLADGALETAPPHALGGDGLLRESDACVLALLNGGGIAPATVRRTVLGPLLRPEHRHLLEALGAYFHTGAATTAAESLHVHAQTLRYRLRRVRELTGHDPHRPWPRFVLETACAIAP
ncbi:CdaR family transcriptional regulator [Nocardiopsis sp. MG754419]|uniref:PucR family transcriptional regulator n=1 Tax=Nocardiopsis sp. MG754419 TaxID=2259865 RepID=UPI001BA552CD|nr:helix-turn-helix domain-containing protein [Nocardiopsis sp. MG754419]MBR8740210.1 PucR family transcriptional regulator [Nocardiopsis sp. MG754419]